MKYEKYYKEAPNDANSYICTLCVPNKLMKKSKDSSTSNLLKHLRIKHKKEYDQFCEEEGAALKEKENMKRKTSLAFGKDPPLKQTKLDEVGAKWSNDCEKSLALDDAVLNLLVKASLPTSFVENEGFKDLMKLATGKKYNLRSRFFFSKNVIPAAFEKAKKQLASAVINQPYISLTADGWSSQNATHSLLGVTGHWITSDFQLVGAALGTCPVKGHHTAANYEELIRNTLKELNIEDHQVHMLVTDGASTMTCLARNMAIKNIHCFSHNMQLAVNDFLESITCWNDTYTAMTQFTRLLHKSSICRENFISCLKMNDLAIRFLGTATEVRWCSMYLLCERFLHAKIAVQKLLIDWKKVPFTEMMWEKIELVKDILKPLNDVTKLVQDDGAAQCSVIIPYVRLLLMAYEDKHDCDYGLKIHNELVYRLQHYLEDETLQVATALDPRFKLDYLLGDSAITTQAKLEALVYAEMKKDREDTPSVFTSQELRTINEETNLIEKFRLKHGQKILPSPDLPEAELKQGAAREVQYYLSEPADTSLGCFSYWRDNNKRFPAISSLVRKYLSAPSTSCESERLFSAARMIVSDYRLGMKTETLEKLLFLKVNSSKLLDKNNN